MSIILRNLKQHPAKTRTLVKSLSKLTDAVSLVSSMEALHPALYYSITTASLCYCPVLLRGHVIAGCPEDGGLDRDFPKSRSSTTSNRHR